MPIKCNLKSFSYNSRVCLSFRKIGAKIENTQKLVKDIIIKVE